MRACILALLLASAIANADVQRTSSIDEGVLVDCPAQNINEFRKEQASRSRSYGFYADFDHSNNPSCIKEKETCAKHVLDDSGSSGYYDPHQVFYILCSDKVVFGSTSEYYENTYGSQFGSATAERSADEALQRIKL